MKMTDTAADAARKLARADIGAVALPSPARMTPKGPDRLNPGVPCAQGIQR